MGQFEHRALPFFKIKSGVGGFSRHAQILLTNAFSGCFHRTIQTSCWLDDQHCCRFARQFFSNCARRLAADFFIRDEKHRDRPRQLAACPSKQSFYHLQRQSDSAFHIEHARSEDAAFCNTKWHLRNRSDWMNSVRMPEQKNRLALAGTGRLESNLQMIAKLFGAMHTNLATQLAETRSQHRTQPVHGGFYVAG